MPDYTVSLNSSQDDALVTLAAAAALSSAVTLQNLVNAALQPTEEIIEAATVALGVAGQAVPSAIRVRMTAGLTAPQLALLGHLAADAAQG